MDLALIGQLVSAAGLGSIVPSIVGYARDRKKTVSDVNKIDTETSLLHFNTVIDRLRQENARLVEANDRAEKELEQEQRRSMMQRARIRELEEEIDAVRESARETQKKCDELANRLEELVASAQED